MAEHTASIAESASEEAKKNSDEVLEALIKQHERLEEIGRFVTLAYVLILIVYFVGDAKIQTLKTKYIHKSGIGIVLGLFVGIGLETIYGEKVYRHFILDDGLFYLGFLPPIIFGGIYNFKKKLFFNMMGTISLYGVLGTVIQFWVFCFLM